jgi:hypothetical protein
MRSIVLLALTSLAAAAASAGGVVNVTFVDPDKFYDAGNSKIDVPANLKAIEEHLQGLGRRYLPDGQVLNITVLDVDLAGYTRITRSGQMVRLAISLADYPKFTVHYSVLADGQQIKSGDEVVTDMDYNRNGQSYAQWDPLRIEKRTLDDWFRVRFTDHQPPQ